MKTAALSWLPVKPLPSLPPQPPLPSHVVLEVVLQVQCQGWDVMKWQEIGEVGEVGEVGEIGEIGGLVRMGKVERRSEVLLE